jgi:hypothetical protein
MISGFGVLRARKGARINSGKEVFNDFDHHGQLEGHELDNADVNRAITVDSR